MLKFFSRLYIRVLVLSILVTHWYTKWVDDWLDIGIHVISYQYCYADAVVTRSNF